MSDQTAETEPTANEHLERILSEGFRLELMALLNRHSIDVSLDMPDFVLAQQIQAGLAADLNAHESRLIWQGRNRWEMTADPSDR